MRGQCVYLQVLVQMYMKGWTSHQLAEQAGISYPSLRRKMRGASPLHLEEARKIQAVLGCGMTLDQLFARKEQTHDR
mgnify:CR=1 FL=1